MGVANPFLTRKGERSHAEVGSRKQKGKGPKKGREKIKKNL